MEHIKKIYQDQLVYVFNKDQCLDLKKDYLVIIKNECEIKDIENCLIMHYQDDFESLLKMSLPTKMRKTNKLLSYQESYHIIEQGTYGVLSFVYQDLPYSIGINHIIMDGCIYFHCGKAGFKLNGIQQRVSFLVIEDLGINYEVGTHNYRSVVVYGTLKEVTDIAKKKTILLKLVEQLAPQHPYNDHMLTYTKILALDIDYMIGKKHIY